MNCRFIIFDTETTGITKDKQAVEVALLEIDENMEPLGSASSLIRPSVPIAPQAAAIHGITEEMLVNAPTITEWVDSVFEGGLEGDIVLIGHRISFDEPLFEPIGNVVATLDTLRLAQQYAHGAPNRKLDTLKAHFSLPGGGESHRAMADVLTCHQLLQKLLPMTGRSLVDLADTGDAVVHHMPWGKHEGTLLLDLPRGYRKWLRELEDLDPSLRRSLEAVAAAIDPPGIAVSPYGTRRKITIPTRKT